MRFLRQGYVSPELPPELQHDFRSKEKVYGNVIRCPHGHEMEQLMTHKAGWLRCDVCGQPQGLGRRMHGCWDCDYHVCSKCEDKFEDAEWYATWFSYWHPTPEGSHASVAAEVDEPATGSNDGSPKGRPGCPGGHSMTEFFSTKTPRLRCDICGVPQRPFVRMWGCHECNYDVGQCCASKFQDDNWRSSWGTFWCVTEPEQPDVQAEAAHREPAPVTALAAPGPSPTTATPPDLPGSQQEQNTELEVQKVITKAKPKPLKNVERDIHAAHQESTKTMPLGGKNEELAPGTLLHAQSFMQQKPAERKPIEQASQNNPEAVKFIQKKGPKRKTAKVAEGGVLQKATSKADLVEDKAEKGSRRTKRGEMANPQEGKVEGAPVEEEKEEDTSGKVMRTDKGEGKEKKERKEKKEGRAERQERYERRQREQEEKAAADAADAATPQLEAEAPPPVIRLQGAAPPSRKDAASKEPKEKKEKKERKEASDTTEAKEKKEKKERKHRKTRREEDG
mmetsp:Transcript_36653/g.84524  ORF Transcript_36653/g.84524 Transcript_36653/m.84524 type:complete len:507 (-) Transcript_36653:132-1652(-)